MLFAQVGANISDTQTPAASPTEAGAASGAAGAASDAGAPTGESAEAAADAAGGFDWTTLLDRQTLMDYAVNIAGALAIFLAAWIIAGWITRMTGAAMRKAKIDETLTRFVEKMVGWLVLIMAGLGCLGMFGIETTSFAAVLGAAGLAVGLAFQGTLSNFAAGVMLLVFRPFSVGDVVTAGGSTGKVDAISIFTTTIDTFDNRRFILPNSEVFGTTIENITFHPIRRADIDVGVAYDADIDKTREVLTAAANNIEGGLETPEPAVVLLGLGGSSVDWSVRVWAPRDNFMDVKQATIRAVKYALDQAEIGIPFPQMDVHLDDLRVEPKPASPSEGVVPRRANAPSTSS